MTNANLIKRFVQETLGCGCPEEVFRSIEYRRNFRLNSFIVLSARIIIGNRLLIYVTESGSGACIEEHLPVLMAMGRKERDEKGLNRFRLVFVTDDPAEVQRTAEKMFEELRGMDEKMHLHVIHTKANPFATESTENSEERLK
jgi:hypothetical protein